MNDFMRIMLLIIGYDAASAAGMPMPSNAAPRAISAVTSMDGS